MKVVAAVRVFDCKVSVWQVADKFGNHGARVESHNLVHVIAELVLRIQPQCDRTV